jgi:hypothetical protein
MATCRQRALDVLVNAKKKERAMGLEVEEVENEGIEHLPMLGFIHYDAPIDRSDKADNAFGDTTLARTQSGVTR